MQSYAEELRAQQAFSDRLRSLKSAVCTDIARLASDLQKIDKVLTEGDESHSQQTRHYYRGFQRHLQAEVNYLAKTCEFLREGADFEDGATTRDIIKLTRTQYTEIGQEERRNATIFEQAELIETTKLKNLMEQQATFIELELRHSSQKVEELTNLARSLETLREENELVELRDRFSGVDMGNCEPPVEIPVSKSEKKQCKEESADLSWVRPIAQPPCDTQEEDPFLTINQPENHIQPPKHCSVALIDESTQMIQINRAGSQQEIIPKEYKLMEEAPQKENFSQQATLSGDNDIEQMQEEYLQIKRELQESGVL